MNKIQFWLRNARPEALPQSVMPALLAVCMTAGKSNFSWWASAAAVVGVAFAHLSTNLLDDYFDYRNAHIEAREKLQRAGMRARIGKAPYLAEGTATLRQTLGVALLLAAIAVVLGIAVACYRGWPVVWLAAAGGLLAYSYSGKPLKLGYHGLSEVITGIIFGPLMMPGVYYAACGTFDPQVWLLSVVVGLLVINILYTHSILDRTADLSVGKTTLAGLLPSPGAQLAFSALFNFAPPLIILVGIGTGLLSPWYALTLLTLPMGIGLFRMMAGWFRDPARRYEKRWWMGPMSNWDTIVKYELDWFMIRWFLSRNYLTFLLLIAAVVALCVRG